MTRTARCPACGGAAWVPALRLPASAILRCAGCGLGRTEPPPAEADGREQFADSPEYFRRALAEPKDRWWRRFNEAPLDALAAAGAPPRPALPDVGADVGYLVTAAGARGYRARGLDGPLAAVAVRPPLLRPPLT